MRAKSLVKKWKQDIAFAPVPIKSPKMTKVELEVKEESKKDNSNESSAKSSAESSIDSLNQKELVDDDVIKLVKRMRNVKVDKVAVTQTGTLMRDKSREMLYSALATNTDVDSQLAIRKACAVESECWKLFPFTSPSSSTAESDAMMEEYKNKIRSLFLNLKSADNETLKIRILSSSMTPAVFCTLSADEMKSRQRMDEERQLREHNLFLAQGAKPQEAETDQFKCGKCRQRKCRYYQMQTRSADEPMTTFVTCTNCNHKWKFC